MTSGKIILISGIGQGAFIFGLEHPDGNIPIEYTDDHERGLHEGQTLAKWLGLRFHQTVLS